MNTIVKQLALAMLCLAIQAPSQGVVKTSLSEDGEVLSVDIRQDVTSLLLAEYQSLCSSLPLRIRNVCTETNVTDVTPVYLAAWLHAEATIPTLLDIIDLPGANEPNQPYWDKVEKMRALPPVNGVRPVMTTIGWRPPPPPSPAAGALSLMPVSFSTLTNLIVQAKAGSRRAECLAWIAAVKYPDDFEAVLENRSIEQDSVWSAVVQFISSLEYRMPPDLSTYIGNFPDEDRAAYRRVFYQLRQEVEFAQCNEDKQGELYAREALRKIGHSYDEPQSFWPQ